MVLGFSELRKSAAINEAERGREGGREAGGDDFDLGPWGLLSISRVKCRTTKQ